MPIEKVAVLGAGRMGCAMARLLSGTVEVEIASRAGHIDHADIGKAIPVIDYRVAAERADTVLLAVPWWGVDESLRCLDGLDGKILVDVTNPFVDDTYQHMAALDGSGAETIQRRLPGFRVVKAFNYLSAAVAGEYAYRLDRPRPLILVCGEDPAAKTAVVDLARDAGLDPRDVGPLARSATLEGLTQLFVELMVRGLGPNFAITLDGEPS